MSVCVYVTVCLYLIMYMYSTVNVLITVLQCQWAIYCAVNLPFNFTVRNVLYCIYTVLYFILYCTINVLYTILYS